VSSRRAVSSPMRPDRREVVVPYRVLSRDAVAGFIGFPAPGSTLALAERLVHPVFLTPHVAKDATPWTILSMRFDPPTRCSRCLRRSLSAYGTSPGVFRLFSARGEESPRPPRGGPPVARSCRRFPSRRLRCRSQVFPTSQRLLPLSALPPFSGRWRSWGSALQGVSPSTKPRRLIVAGIPSWPLSRGLRELPS